MGKLKKFLSLFLVMAIVLVGCTPSNITKTKSPEILEQEVATEEQEINMKEQVKYRTLLSPSGTFSIVRKPNTLSFSRGKITELPSYNPNSSTMWQLDLRSSDLTRLDLSERINDLLHSDFDTKTKWPKKLPKGFEPQKIMELGKNPGLGVRDLHKKGITGKGIGIAIIDQGLLVDHVEYKEQLKLYEEIHSSDEFAQMHGPAVASIAVGKTVGVAPEASLYYIAATQGEYNEKGEFDLDLSWFAKSIDRIVEINKTLPEGEKIRVISISLGMEERMNGSKDVFDSIEEAKKEGIYTVYVNSNPYFGLGRDPLKDPDDIASFTKGEFWRNLPYGNNELLVPMDYRCTASPTGNDDYALYVQGGMSWAVPYVAGLYALACQVNPDITPDTFWMEALNTSDTISDGNNGGGKLGKIVNPGKLIEKISSK